MCFFGDVDDVDTTNVDYRNLQNIPMTNVDDRKVSYP